MAAPVIKNYKDQSIIYFENDRADEVYVLKSGRVILTYTPVDSKTEVKEDVKIGEFFGVKSAIGHYPREETAQVIGQATVFSFKLSDFEDFVGKNTHLIIKMMKVFSSNLRQYHSKVRQHLGQFGDVKSPAYELMNVAEVFYKNGHFEHAVYGFQKYLYHYPGGVYTARAQELLNLAKRQSAYPSNMPELVYEYEKKTVQPIQSNQSVQPAKQSQTLNSSKISSLYKEAKSDYDSYDFSSAADKYKEITTLTASSDSEKSMIEDAFFYTALSQLNANSMDAAFLSFSVYVKNYPTSPKAKEAIYHLGEISELKRDIPKAITLYTKSASIPPIDEWTNKAKEKINSLKG